MLKFSVVRDSQQNEFFKGLSHFQHNEEFVDMTIAVDGHMIKVHQNIMALASPYLREVLKCVPCTHPVLFLNNIKHDICCFILEYVYLGEVIIPQDKMEQFMTVAQNLQISGLTNTEKTYTQNINNQEKSIPKALPKYSVTKQVESFSTNSNQKTINILSDLKFSNKNESTSTRHISNTDIEKSATNMFLTNNTNTIPHTNIYDTEFSQFLTTGGHPSNNIFPIDNIVPTVQYSTSAVQHTNSLTAITSTDQEPQLEDQPMEYSDQPLTLDQPPIHFNISFDVNGQSTLSLVKDSKDPPKVEQNATCSNKRDTLEEKTNKLNNKPGIPQYTLSNRGNPQIILNRFIYSLHHTHKTGNKRRWRCVDYRRVGCQAYIDTEGEILIGRLNTHKHEFHDEIIDYKARNHLFFPNLHHILNARKEEQHRKQRALENLETITKEN